MIGDWSRLQMAADQSIQCTRQAILCFQYMSCRSTRKRQSSPIWNVHVCAVLNRTFCTYGSAKDLGMTAAVQAMDYSTRREACGACVVEIVRYRWHSAGLSFSVTAFLMFSVTLCCDNATIVQSSLFQVPWRQVSRADVLGQVGACSQVLLWRCSQECCLRYPLPWRESSDVCTACAT